MKVRFSIQYDTRWGESLAVVLGGKKYPLYWSEGNVWRAEVTASAAALSDYTYVLMEDGIVTRPEWTRHFLKVKAGTKTLDVKDSWIECPFCGCDFPRMHSRADFDKPGFRGAGTVIPVFALRSEDDFGIGDFRDLRPLVDWAARTGQSIIQLLPVNDTTRQGGWDDSYPYAPVSSFALHPIYVRLQDLGIRETPAFRKAQRELNALAEIDYPRVFKAKMAYVRKAWKACGAKDTASAAFKRFCKDNSEWLPEYADFCARRDGEETLFYEWLQFHLDRQFFEEAEYARSKGVSFKGDLPIGVSGDSADAFFHPELFNLDCSAGAPPDFFSADGQNWGFPTYNWEAMAADDYSWWKKRLCKMSRWFDAFRIDHILGFFRIWEIPQGCVSGKDGHFNPALSYPGEEIVSMGLPLEGLFHEDPRRPGEFQPLISPDTSSLQPWQKDRYDALYVDFFYHRNDGFWRRNALRKLPELLGATGMLACGEDLGMVPDCVNGVMDHEAILSLEMPCMEKGRPWPRKSVCATSSHDMQTLRMQQPEDPSPAECKRILQGCLDSASMLAIFPLQDWLSLDGSLRRPDRDAERINEPANPHHHWRYRMHFCLSRLLSDDAIGFNADVEGMLKDSARFN